MQRPCSRWHDTKKTEENCIRQLERWILVELAKMVTPYLFALDMGLTRSNGSKDQDQPTNQKDSFMHMEVNSFTKTEFHNIDCDPLFHSVHGVTCLNFNYHFRLGPIHSGLEWWFGTEYGHSLLRCIHTHDRSLLSFGEESRWVADENSGDLSCSARREHEKLIFSVQFDSGATDQHHWHLGETRSDDCQRSRFFYSNSIQ